MVEKVVYLFLYSLIIRYKFERDSLFETSSIVFYYARHVLLSLILNGIAS
jgi:hypothetical protein